MKKAILIIAVSLALVNCGLGGQHSLESHFINMDEIIDDEHVSYVDGVLHIDDEKIDLPEGDSLRINYRNSNGVVRYTVRVDGEIVREVTGTTES